MATKAPKSNPFQASMTRLQIPPHMGTSLSIAGFSLEADEDRTVEVPKNLVGEMKSHGLVDYVEPADAMAK